MISSIVESYKKKVHILNLISQHFNKQLIENTEPLNYCLDRVRDRETIDTFLLGYGKGIQDLINKESVREEELIELGILTDNDTFLYDKFDDRVIFPIFDISGNVVGLSGRVWRESDNRSKYIISNNTDVFQKSLSLYGLYQSLPFIKKYKTVFVVEGNVDVISSYREGIKITVSPFGTSFMKEHLLLLRQFADIFIFCQDADKGGKKSVERIKKLVQEENIKAGFINLPEKEKDPDNFIKKYGSSPLIESIIDIRNQLLSV